MATLVHRHKTGQGQWIDLGMYQLGPLVIPEAFIAVQSGEADIGCRGNAEWNTAFSGVFRSAGDNQWVTVSAKDEQALQALYVLVQAPAQGTLAQLQAAVQSWCLRQSAQQSAALLQGAGVAAGAVNDARDLIREPQLVARRFFECVDFESDIGPRALIGRPYVWTGAEVGIQRRAPHFGEDNTPVLRDLLQLPAERITALRDSSVVSDHPMNPPHLRPIDIDTLVKLGTIKAHDKQYREASQLPSTFRLEIAS
jgi:formyl-CoA transferase